MDQTANVDTMPASPSSNGGLRPNKRQRPDDNEAFYCKCTTPDCLTLSCPCFCAASLCCEACRCQVCGNAPDIKQGIQMTPEEIESQYPIPFVPKETSNENPSTLRHTACACRADCLSIVCACTMLSSACSIYCCCYACLNPFGKKGGGVQCSTVPTYPLAFDPTAVRESKPLVHQQIGSVSSSAFDRINIPPSIFGQQIGSANPLAFDQTVARVPELPLFSHQLHVRSTSPSTSNPLMMRNSTFPWTFVFDKTIARVQKLPLFSRQQQIRSTSPSTTDPSTMRNYIHPWFLVHQIKPANPPSFDQTVARLPKLPLISGLQKVPVNAEACNCRKSKCKNKYCSCVKYGVRCTNKCTCQGCLNLHGGRESS